jgi:cadmium resistance protein CadD (predicted permease)
MPDDLALVIGASALVFASTNVDDFVLLLAFFGTERRHAGSIIAGQYLGIAVLVAVSLAGATVANRLSSPVVGLLGLVPIVLGLRRLGSPATGDEPVPTASGLRAAHVASVALATIGSGGDNIAAYVPFFAALEPRGRLASVLVFACLTGVWCLGARAVVGQPRVEALIVRGGRRLVGWVMIGLGAIILVRAGTLAVLICGAR